MFKYYGQIYVSLHIIRTTNEKFFVYTGAGTGGAIEKACNFLH